MKGKWVTTGAVFTREEQMLLWSLALALIVGGAAMWFYARVPGSKQPDTEPLTVDLHDKGEGNAPQRIPPSSTMSGSPPQGKQKASRSGQPASDNLTRADTQAKDRELVAGAKSEDAGQGIEALYASEVVQHATVSPSLDNSVSEAEVVVSVQGCVRRPGLYRMPAGARVGDVLERAGGVNQDGDTSALNLAALLVDGTTLFVPAGLAVERKEGVLKARGRRSQVNTYEGYLLDGGQRAPFVEAQTSRGSSPVGSLSSQEAAASSAPQLSSNADISTALLNLNTATAAELERLPGIGPGLASRIVAYREQQPFTRPEDLMNVSGIGPKRYEAVRHLITAP